MAQTLAQLQKQIAALEAKAAKVRQAEAKGLISKIRAAIDAYGLTAQDLFGPTARKSKGPGRPRATEAKYSDGKGNTWVGRGKRPEWLRTALAEGASLAQFAVAVAVAQAPSAAEGGPNARVPRPAKNVSGRKTAANKALKAKYQDGAGNTWSGRGRRPRWIVEALAAGKTVEDFAP